MLIIMKTLIYATPAVKGLKVQQPLCNKSNRTLLILKSAYCGTDRNMVET